MYLHNSRSSKVLPLFLTHVRRTVFSIWKGLTKKENGKKKKKTGKLVVEGDWVAWRQTRRMREENAQVTARSCGSTLLLNDASELAVRGETLIVGRSPCVLKWQTKRSNTHISVVYTFFFYLLNERNERALFLPYHLFFFFPFTVLTTYTHTKKNPTIKPEST